MLQVCFVRSLCALEYEFVVNPFKPHLSMGGCLCEVPNGRSRILLLSD